MPPDGSESANLGWWLVAAAGAVATLCFAYREPLRRFWLRTEDPRTLGLFRIAFALLLLLNTGGLLGYAEFLFSNEGLLSTARAREMYAASQFPADGSALAYLGGPYHSLLWFWDSPGFVWLHIALVAVSTLALLVGYRTRTSAVVAWFFTLSLWLRSWLFWEGTESVFCCFFFYLLFARSGEAYSIDAWLARRRDPQRPTYPAIPAWPRRMMMLQLALLYLYTGVMKYGPTWTSGDAFYYALNLDHFYRFYPQGLSATFGTNLFRLMTWVTRWWEVLFPAVFAGALLRAHQRDPVELDRRERVVGLAAWTLLAVIVTRILAVWLDMGGSRHLALTIAVGGLGCLGLVLAWPRLDERGRQWLLRWPLSRRLWLGVGVVFHLHLFVLMNIGMFPLIMISTYICYLDGPQVGAWVTRLMRRLGRSFSDEPTEQREDWAYGSTGRRLVAVGVSAHVIAICVWLLPGEQSLRSIREPGRELVAPWILRTHTEQAWGMFAPDAPTENAFLKVLVTDADGEVWDLRTDLYAEEAQPIPYVPYDRFRKMSRIISVGEAGAGDTYPPHFARWLCDDWERTHGEAALRVELVTVWYPTPSPEEMARMGGYHPQERLAAVGEQRSLHLRWCDEPADLSSPR